MLRGETVGSKSARHATTATVSSNKVLVAVKAEKVISNTALAWALTHIVHSSDSITLLAVYSTEKTGRRFWNVSRLMAGNCSNGRAGKLPEEISDISESCAQMVFQLHNHIEVRVKIKVVTGTPSGAVAAEARWSGSHWVILDKKLKQEIKHCMDELSCSIVVMNGSQPKVLRLNLGGHSDELQTPFFSSSSSPGIQTGKLKGRRLKHSTPVGSPEVTGSSVTRSIGVDSVSSSDSMTSPFLVYKENPLYEGHGSHKSTNKSINKPKDFNFQPPYFNLERDSPPPSRKLPTSSLASDKNTEFWIHQNHINNEKLQRAENRIIPRTKSPNSKTLLENFLHCDQEKRTNKLEFNKAENRSYVTSPSIRDSPIPLGRNSSIPPPLCSQCQNIAPVFGNPPRRFSYREIEEATDMFSDLNFLAEGGFGVVHRGILKDGQVVAVKQLKSSGSQADLDFCREVRVLSCAQHRNIVLLIGFCTEDNVRILVYEYVCNGSLDLCLHGKEGIPLDWNSRLKIAIGVARGLRYLHEDCRVGCIVHRDIRPKNILLTHDFEPLVADFGLARWQSEWNINTEDRVMGTSGYIAPEYLDSGILTYKVDVYAFGIVLLELITGRRNNELEQFNGHSYLSEWFHPLHMLDPNHILQNVGSLNPCLDSEGSLESNLQLQAMTQAASLCLRLDPDHRPPISKILRVLEGGNPVRPLDLDINSIGNASGRLSGLSSYTPPKGTISHSRMLSH
ncbi:non-specific serine/threonine protein kinase [Trifolium repens]|nr:non-specific serine/threonine protein kinase [Trifolium repens]